MAILDIRIKIYSIDKPPNIFPLTEPIVPFSNQYDGHYSS